jgi:hypothetical protein
LLLELGTKLRFSLSTFFLGLNGCAFQLSCDTTGLVYGLLGNWYGGWLNFGGTSCYLLYSSFSYI